MKLPGVVVILEDRALQRHPNLRAFELPAGMRTAVPVVVRVRAAAIFFSNSPTNSFALTRCRNVPVTTRCRAVSNST